VANLVQVHAERFEHSCGDALPFADEAEQEVLRADVVVAEASRLVDGQLDDPLGAGSEADLADDRSVTPADDELDGSADLGQLDVHVLEDTRSHALALTDESQEEVLRTDVVVIEALCLVLGERENLAGAVGELVEPVHGD